MKNVIKSGTMEKFFCNDSLIKNFSLVQRILLWVYYQYNLIPISVLVCSYKGEKDLHKETENQFMLKYKLFLLDQIVEVK